MKKKKVGRKSARSLVERNWKELCQLVSEGNGIQQACTMLGIGRGSYWVYTTSEQREFLMELRKESSFTYNTTYVVEQEESRPDRFIYDAY